MNQGSCVTCGEPLPTWSRADRRTCSVRCRVAHQRRSRGSTSEPDPAPPTTGMNGLVTGVVAVTSASRDRRAREDLAAPKDDGTLLRLSSWLGDVSAEAALRDPLEADAR
jgi:hypothetical protein